MDQRLFFPATERNRGPIGDLLKQLLPGSGAVLELASGSGEHAVCFQQRFPHLRWQASDPDPDHRASINAWIQHQGLSQVMPAALNLDVEHRPWPLPQNLQGAVKAVVCINLLHISPASCTDAVLEESALLLPSGAPLDRLWPIQAQWCSHQCKQCRLRPIPQGTQPPMGIAGAESRNSHRRQGWLQNRKRGLHARQQSDFGVSARLSPISLASDWKATDNHAVSPV